MATDQQVALTRSHRMSSTSSHISKAARQVVPAFLQKLYEMVNDPNNAELIRWSETGDSFFVLDHERFAHEVLGRWFKHRNFSSFVRQLNMYGFHKIPHLQQGVLKSDTDTEFWNFAHANFHRGQPDLLCLILRKKQTAQLGDEPTVELRDATNAPGLIGPSNPTAAAGGTAPNTAATLSNTQVLDIHSVVSGINAIKRHQTTISAELNELKRSNQLLWQDALVTRTRHQKQQDTINRIVKFLAGVFGSHPAAAGAGVGVPGGTQGVVNGQGNLDGVDGSWRRVRLMIEDAKRDGPTKSMVEELTEIPTELDNVMQYAETPITIPTPAPAAEGASFPLASNSEVPNGDSTQSKQAKPVPAESQAQQEKQQISRAVTPNRSPTIEINSRMLNQLSPSQIQLLLASITAQAMSDPLPSSSSAETTINPSAITQYQPHFDFSQANSALNNLPIVDGLISFDNYDPLLPGETTHSVVPSGQQQEHEREQQMEDQWKTTEKLDKDVSAMDTSINSFIQNFGLDPILFQDENHQTETNGGTTSQAAAAEAATIAPSSDFDIDSFLNDLSNVSDSLGIGLGGDSLTSTAAFLDEVHTPTASSSDMTGSPVQSLRQVSPEMTMTGTSDAGTTSPGGGVANLSTLNISGGGVVPTAAAAAFGASSTTGKGSVGVGSVVGGKKRKSEVISDIDPAATALSDTTKGGKAKRRKDK